MNPIQQIAKLRPDLGTGELLSAHATWALASAKSYEAGDGEIDMESYISAWQKPVHPLAAMFKLAIDNGHPVTVIGDGRMTKFNQGEK